MDYVILIDGLNLMSLMSLMLGFFWNVNIYGASALTGRETVPAG